MFDRNLFFNKCNDHKNSSKSIKFTAVNSSGHVQSSPEFPMKYDIEVLIPVYTHGNIPIFKYGTQATVILNTGS